MDVGHTAMLCKVVKGFKVNMIPVGDQASHQSVLHPDTPNEAVTVMDERRLSTSSTRYRRSQASASRCAGLQSSAPLGP